MGRNFPSIRSLDTKPRNYLCQAHAHRNSSHLWSRNFRNWARANSKMRPREKGYWVRSAAWAPADRVALRHVLPQLVRGTAILTRILRARPQTRPAVRVAPTIARRTLRSLKRYAAAGVPITRRKAGGTVAREMQQVLGSPVAVASSIANNVRAAGLLRAGA